MYTILFIIFTWTSGNCSLYQVKLSVNMDLSCEAPIRILWIEATFYYIVFYTWSFLLTSFCAYDADQGSQKEQMYLFLEISSFHL